MNSLKSNSLALTVIIRWLITFLVIGGFIVYFFLNNEKFSPLLDIKIWFLIFIAICESAFFLINGLMTKYILRPFGKELPLAETTYIAIITSVGNFFAPAGAGLAIRAVYLKKKHQVNYADYISILAGNYLVVIMVNSFFGLLALLLLHSRADSRYMVLVLFFVTLLLLCAVLAMVKVPASLAGRIKHKGLAAIAMIFHRITEGWRRIVNYPELLLQLVLLTIANLVITSAIFWLIVSALDLKVGFAALLLFGVISVMSLFLNITPANIGVKEALFIFSSYSLGLSINDIILISLIDRSIFFVMIFLAYVTLRLKGGFSLRSEN